MNRASISDPTKIKYPFKKRTYGKFYAVFSENICLKNFDFFYENKTTVVLIFIFEVFGGKYLCFMVIEFFNP
jgi:hypothetical protein